MATRTRERQGEHASGTDARAQRNALQPVESPRTFEAVIDQIVGMIERLGLEQGDRLLNIPELAGSLEVSRPTVREALRVLEQSGLVRVLRGRAGGGVYVTDDTVPVEVISAHVSGADEHFVSLLAARRLFEGLASHLAAAQATPDDLRAVERTIVLSRRYQDEPARLVRTDGMFHRAVARAAHSDSLERAVAGTLRQLMPLRDAWGSRGRLKPREPRPSNVPLLTPSSLISIHERHFDAIRHGDHQELDDVLHEHLTWLEALFAAASGRGIETLYDLPRRQMLGTLTTQAKVRKSRSSARPRS